MAKHYTDKSEKATQRCSKRGSLVRVVLAAILLLIALVTMFVFSQAPQLFFPAHRSFSKRFLEVLSLLFSFSPFALWDFFAVVTVLVALVFLVRKPLKTLSWMFLALALCADIFVFGWALNHYAPTLATELELELRETSVDELEAATRFYLECAARTSRDVPRASDWQLEAQDFYELARVAGSSYGDLGERYPIFTGATAPVKSLLIFGEPLLYSGHIGIFCALTAEASVPLNCATAELPFTMCHEAAHRLALAREDEANFAACLACTTHDDPRFIYSGYLLAFNYCFSALTRHAPERARSLVSQELSGVLTVGVHLVLADRAAMREHYQAYEGEFQEVGRRVNDSYLRSFGESEGVQSYGGVVDYLVAWYEQEEQH